MWDQKLGMKAKKERRTFRYLCHCRIIAKGEVAGMWFVTFASIVMLNGYWGLCY